MIARRLASAMLALACATLPLTCLADKSDKDKPVNFSSDQGGANYETKSGSLKGNVVLTQGTMTIRADRIDFKQNADSSLSATVYGNPLSFRQKKDDSDEYFEGYAQRAVYDGQKQFLELFDHALLRQGNDEIRSNYISYNTATGVATAEGRPDKAGDPAGPGARVRGMFQPREESTPGAKAAPGAKGTPAPKAEPKVDKGPPLKLTPDSSLKQ